MDFFDLGYLGLFLATFLSATVVPFSSEAVLAAMMMASYDAFYCFLIATSGNTFGGMSSFYLGYLGDWDRIQRWLGVEQTSIDRWKSHIDKYGAYAAIMCWLPFVGDVIAIALGIFRVNTIRVFGWMTLGKAARYAAIIWVFS